MSNEILAMRGVPLTYETVREWCLKFGCGHSFFEADGLGRLDPANLVVSFANVRNNRPIDCPAPPTFQADPLEQSLSDWRFASSPPRLQGFPLSAVNCSHIPAMSESSNILFLSSSSSHSSP
jgi:hypothetical protein